MDYEDEAPTKANNHAVPYQRFDTLDLFYHGAPSGTDHGTTPLEPWAAIIQRYLDPFIDPDTSDAQDVVLLDLSPGAGESIWHLLSLLTRVAQGTPLNLQYIACSADSRCLELLARHPLLRNDIERGVLHLGQWQQGKLHCPTLRPMTHPAVVVLCQHHLQTLPQNLYWPHAQHISEVQVRATPCGEGEDAWQLDYDWQREPTHPPDLPAATTRVLQHYLARGMNSAVLLPTAAADLIHAIHHWSGGNYLLLAMEYGCTTEHQIRMGACHPPATWRTGDALPPLNFHALNALVERPGTWSWQHQLQDDGLILHATLATTSTDHATWQRYFDGICATLAHHHPQDLQALAASMPAPGAPDYASRALSLLRLSGYESRVLQRAIEHMIDHPPPMDHACRRHWRAALRTTWQRHFPRLENDPFYFQVALLAANMGDWPLVRECLDWGLSVFGADATELALLASCEDATGNPTRAIELLEFALALSPGYGYALAQRQQLEARVQRWQHQRWYWPAAAGADTLCLQPLGPEHAHAFLHQYRDPHIGHLTDMPELENLADYHTWLNRQNQPQRALFAVMHEDHGFVGMVAMQCAPPAGYFYFWIGVDYQGQGFGQQAARCLLRMMAAQGIDDVFTSAYHYNQRSQAALQQLGFYRLPVQAAEPDRDVVFFHCPSSKRSYIEPVVERLQALCEAIGSPLVLDCADSHVDPGFAPVSCGNDGKSGANWLVPSP